MANKYIKPETQTIKVELQHVIAESFQKFDGDVETPRSRDFSFDFFIEEEEEAPGKSDDDDWEDWEDEEDP